MSRYKSRNIEYHKDISAEPLEKLEMTEERRAKHCDIEVRIAINIRGVKTQSGLVRQDKQSSYIT